MPMAFSASCESPGWLKKFKLAREGKWALTTKSLTELADLAMILLALDRSDEAYLVAEFVCGKLKFTGDKAIWTFYEVPCLIAYRLAPASLPPAARESLVADFLRHPPHSAIDSGFLEHSLAEWKLWVDNPWGEKRPTSVERTLMLTVLKSANTYLAEHEAKFPNSEWYPVNELQRVHDLALHRLKTLVT